MYSAYLCDCVHVYVKNLISKSLVWLNYCFTVIQGILQFSMKNMYILCLSTLAQYPVAILCCFPLNEGEMKAEEPGERADKEVCFPLPELGKALIP